MTDPTFMSLLPTGGVASVLVIVIVYLLRQNYTDRVQYRKDVADSEDRHVAEIKALEARHLREMKAVRDELAELGSKIATTLEQLEVERQKRWEAEDAAAKYRRQLEDPEGAVK